MVERFLSCSYPSGSEPHHGLFLVVNEAIRHHNMFSHPPVLVDPISQVYPVRGQSLRFIWSKGKGDISKGAKKQRSQGQKRKPETAPGKRQKKAERSMKR
jgi:hypothetical protein